MSTTVDNRIVEMQFDNRQFEQNVNQSILTLDKLKNALKFEKTGEALKQLDSSIGRTSFSGLEGGIAQVEARFSALGTIAFTVLQDMTRSAVNAGKNIVNALAIEPVTTGFQEYETQMGAIQTILANTKSKGSTLDDVNRALGELNTYADKTIYNFTEMTRNIGTFTAAGVKLDDATQSIKGIANLAAVSGSTSQQASTAMYQLSQALASGTIKLQDWNSVVNAGMGGEVFQNALKRTAKNMGVNVDAMIKKYGSFRESLSKGNWLTKDVLTETLNQFANVYSEKELIQKGYTEKQAKEILELGQTAEDAATKVKTITQLWDTLKEASQSGWTQSWQLLVGDFEEAKTVLTDISNSVGAIIDAQSDARNALLKQAFGEHEMKGAEWKNTFGQLYKDAYADTIDDQKMFISTSKLFGQDMEKLIMKSEAYSKALDKGVISKKDSLDTILKKTDAFKEVMESGIVDKKMLEGVYKYNSGIGNLAKNQKEAKKNQQKLRKEVNESIKTNKTGGEVLKDLTENKLIPEQRVMANLTGKLRNAGTSYADFGKETKKLKGYTEEETRKLYELKEALEQSDNPMVKLMRDMERPTGRTNVIEGMRNILLGMGDVIKAVGKAYHTVFQKMDATGVYKLTENFRAFTKTLRLSKDGARAITFALIPFFGAIKIGLKVLVVFVKTIGLFIKTAFNLLKIVASLAAGILNFVQNLSKGAKVTTSWAKLMKVVRDAFASAQKVLSSFVSKISEFLSKVKSLPGVKKLADAIGEIATHVATFAFDKLSGFISIISKFFKSVGSFLPSMDTVLGFFDSLADTIANFLSGAFGGASADPSKALEKSGIGKVADVIGQFGSRFKSVEKPFKDAKDSIVDLFKSFAKEFVNAINGLNFGNVLQVLNAGGVFLLILSFTKMFFSLGGLLKTGKKLTEKFGKLMGTFGDTLKAYQMSLKAEAFFMIAKAIIALVGAMVVMSLIPSDKLATVTVDLAVVLIALAFLVKMISQIGESSSPIEDAAGGIKGAITKMIDSFKDTIKQSAKIASFGLFAMLLGVAVGFLANAIAILADIPVGKSLFVMGEITLLMFLIVEAGKFVNKHAKDITPGMGLALAALGSAVLKLAKAAAILGSMDLPALLKGVGSVVVLMGMIGLIAKASKDAKMISVGAGMLILAFALSVLLPNIVAFSLIPWATFGKGVAMMGMLAIGMAVISRIASDSMAGAASMLLIAAAIQALLVPLLVLGVTLPIALLGIVGMAAALLVLVGVAKLAEVAEAGLLALAASLLAIGAGMVLVSASTLLFAAAIGIIVTAISLFSATLPLLVANLSNLMVAIINGADVIVRALTVLLDSLAVAIIKTAPKFGRAAVAVLGAIISALTAALPMLLNFLLVAFTTIMDWLNIAVPAAFESLVTLFIYGINGLALAIDNNSTAIIMAVANLLAAVGNLVFEALAQIAEQVPGVGKIAAKKLRDCKVDIESAIPKEDGKKVTKGYTDGLNEGANSGLSNLVTNAKTKASETSGAFDNLSFDTSAFSNLSSAGLGQMDIFKSGLDGKVTDVNSVLGNVGKGENGDIAANITKSFGNIDMGPVTDSKKKIVSVFSELPTDLGDKGKQASDKLSSSMTNIDTSGVKTFKRNVLTSLSETVKSVGTKSDSIKKSLNNATKVDVDTSGTDKATKKVAKAASSSNKSFGSAGKTSGDKYITDVSSAISRGSSKVKTATSKVATSASQGFRTKYSAFYNSGTHCMSGVVSGLNSKLPAIRTNAIRAANTWNSTYRSHQKISSPSKVTYRFGAWTMMGLVNGMNSQIRNVERSADLASETVKDSLSTPLTAAAQMLDGDLSLSPIITPVLDDTQIRKGVGGINGMFANSSLNLNPFNSSRMMSAVSGLQNGNSNDDVVSAIGKLRGDIRNMQGNQYNINGITYDDGSNVYGAIETLVRAATVEGRA